jgi:hypothetical protein
MPGPRYFWLLSLLVLASCAGYAALVLSSATLAEARALDSITNHLDWHIRPLTDSALWSWRIVLGTASLALGGILTVLITQPANRREFAQLLAELRGWGTDTISLRELPRRQQLSALLAFGLLTMLRIYFSLTKPLHAEEIASYEFFVSKGLLAVSAYYPIPNNHVLSNTVSWLFYQLSPAFWFSMRLPVLLISTLGTGLLYTGLLRFANFRVAILATLLFSWLQLSLYNSSASRGYWLLITLAGLVFFSTLSLAGASGRPRAAWAALLLGGLLGCYTIPTFAYVLASAFSWLGLQFIRRRAWSELRRLLAIGIVLALSSAALYAPLLLISGFDVLVGNGFVVPRAPQEFWTGLPEYVWLTEGMLAGQRSIGALLFVVVIFATAILLSKRPVAPLLSRLGPIALWFILLPYLLVMGQRVFPPERVFLYKSFFFFILVALLLDRLLQQARSPAQRRGAYGAVAIGCLLFAAYQTYHVERLNRKNRRQVEAFRAGFDWLRRQPAGSVLAPEPLHHLYFRFYAHTSAVELHWDLQDRPRPFPAFRYVIAFPDKRGYFQPNYPFPPAYRNDEVEIYQLPKP